MRPFIFCMTIFLIILSNNAVVSGDSTSDKGDATLSRKTKTEQHQAGETWTEPSTGIAFVWVPGGCFQMGTPEGGTFNTAGKKEVGLFDGNVFVSILKVASALLPVGCTSMKTSAPADFNKYTMDERPVHKVCLDGFWVGKYEITQGQWLKVMGNNPSLFKSGDDHPIEMVSWDDSVKFLNKLKDKTGMVFSLPTEAQWEYAARSAGKDETFCAESSVDKVAWYYGNSGQKTHAVGTKSPNALGIYDMRGNVREWCKDEYATDAYKEAHPENPSSTLKKGSHVLRGGSWYLNSCDVRCTNRGWDWAPQANSDVGFRLVRNN